MPLNLNPESAEGHAIKRWLSHLDEHDKGGRAELRRAPSVLSAAMCQATHRLHRQLDTICQGDMSDTQRDRLAMACALMAHIKNPGPLPLPQAMSERKPGSERIPVSELRFRRLLDAHDDEALFSGLRRVLPLIDGHVCPVLLARDVVFWGDTVKRTWAYDYRWPDHN
jgi:CRISPR system Cascade subunit CasB